MHYIAEDIPREVNGKIWASLIAPRPLALISTQDAQGVPNIAPYNPSTLVHDDRLYVLYDRGLVSCFDAKTGAVHYDRQRLPNGFAFTASPWAVGDKIFCLNESGICFVLRAGDKFELLHTNPLADEMCMSTPALAGDRLLIRADQHLYSIRNPSAATR